MELNTDRRYVVLEIHPDDFFYEFRKELGGRVVEVEYGRTSRLVEGEYFYCDAHFIEPVLAENIIIERIVFHAVRLGVLYDEPGTKTEVETDETFEGQKTKVKVRALSLGREVGLRLQGHYSRSG